MNDIQRNTLGTWRDSSLALALYTAASGALTWPVAAHPRSVLFGDYGDTRGYAAWLWARSNGLLDGAVNPLLAAPFGTPTGNAVHHPVPEALAVVLTRAVDEIAAINLSVLIAFPLTAFATYLVLRRLLGVPSAAFVGGLLFGFCPAAVMQAAGGHVLYAINAFVPLFVVALLRNRARRTVGSAFLVAAAFAGIVLSAIYFGYFAVLLGAFFLVYDIATREREDAVRIARNYAACAAFAALLVVPFEWHLIVEQLVAPSEAVARAGHARAFGELDIYAARAWNYLVPPIDHPLFGDAFLSYVRSRLQGSNVFEQTLYLGMVPLVLVGTGIVAAARGTFEPPLRRIFVFFGLAAAWMYFVSLPPLVASGVPTPSFFAYAVLPMFRAYARAGIFVDFFVAGAAAAVLAHLYASMEAGRYRALLAILVPAVALEYWTVPPAHALDVSQPPPVYAWLAAQPGDWSVAEYPMARYDQAAFYNYAFWQRLHRKKLVNGASPDNERAWDVYERIRDLGDPGTPARLKALGVKYVVMHKRMYGEGPIPAPLKRYYSPLQAEANFNGGEPPAIPAGLRFVAAFGQDVVFAVEGP